LLAANLTSSDLVTVGLRRTFASVAAWTVGATASVAVGLLALSLIDSGLTTRSAQPSTPDVLAEASPTRSASADGSAGMGTPSAVAKSASSTSGQGAERVLSSPGGTVVARCSGAGSYLVSWSPAQGYKVDDVRRGPLPETKVVFQTLTVAVDLRVTCVSGVPQGRVAKDYEDDPRPTPSASR
jgi:hypothetical protein